MRENLAIRLPYLEIRVPNIILYLRSGPTLLETQNVVFDHAVTFAG